MSSKRLKKRVPSARGIGAARMDGHTLKFHKVGRDGSGKCDAKETKEQSDYVIGVLYEIDPDEEKKLDKCEGLRQGYDKKLVTVYLNDGSAKEAFTYYATNIIAELKPYDWYMEHVL